MGSLSPERYDFIVVGAGASGATLANRLARSTARPSVLLVEAGGQNQNKEWQIDAERWLHRMNPAQAWGYQTVPQRHLDGQSISYDRGKGLGGSTAINFSLWDIGPRGDHDEIARLVGDDEWKWEQARKRYIRLEDYNGIRDSIPEKYRHYLKPKAEDHGVGGPVKCGFPSVFEDTVLEYLELWQKVTGCRLNTDKNAGDVVGLSVSSQSAQNGSRSTAADQLKDAPDNLHILTDTQIARVVFEDTTVVGIDAIDGRTFRASQEVILSAGTLDTPRILMHSGIGPADQLNNFGIAVKHENANVGQNLCDHQHIQPTWLYGHVDSQRHQFYRSKKLQQEARTQWLEDQTGPLAEIACSCAMGFFKDDAVYESEEFKSLPETCRAHLQHPTVPSYEIALNGASVEYFMDPENTPPVATIFLILMNLQSRGTVSLQTADPSKPLSFDPNYFSHPYDRKLAVLATKQLLKVVNSPDFQKNCKGATSAPKSDSEEDILDYWKKNLNSTWHMTGTCKMGKSPTDDGAVVDKDCRVFGVQGLRVADMSVVPFIPNNHVQSTAYQVGLLLGDKLAAQYSLDK